MSLRHLDGLARLQALDPITAGIETFGRVIGLVNTEQQATLAQQLAQQNAALAQTQSDQAQQQAVQNMVAQQVQANNYARIATAAGALALFGIAGYFTWKALKRK